MATSSIEAEYIEIDGERLLQEWYQYKQALLSIKSELSSHINPVTSAIERGASEEQVERCLAIIKGVL